MITEKTDSVLIKGNNWINELIFRFDTDKLTTTLNSSEADIEILVLGLNGKLINQILLKVK